MEPNDLLAVPADTDLAWQWINVVFPAGADSAYAAAFATFSGTLAFLGSLFLAFHVMTGIVSSAYSGKVLGDRYHQIYAPLRVALGFGMLVPIGDGYSAVHYLLQNVIGVAAVNLGNAPIVAYVDSIALRGGSVGIPSTQGRTVAREFVYKELCRQVYNEYASHRFWSKSIPSPSGTVKDRPSDSWWGSDPSGQKVVVWDYGQCGAISFSMGDASTTGQRAAFYNQRLQITQATKQQISGFINSFNLGEYFAKYDIPEGDTSIVDELISKGYSLPEIRGAFRAAVSNWNNQVGSAASTVFADENQAALGQLRDQVLNYGFMAAGSFERSLSRVSGLAMQLANESPGTTQYSVPDEIATRFKAASDVISNTSRRQANSEDGGSGSSDLDATASGSALLADTFSFLENDPFNEDFDEDPIGSMISFGHYCLAAFQAFLIGKLAFAAIDGAMDGSIAGIAAGLTGVKGAISGVVSEFLSLAGYAMVILLIVGVLHAYVIPMLPFIMVFVMGISWLILFLEAAIAGILWAFAFIRMDGQEFFDKNQSPGVTLLFNLLLRPAIGMLAFIGGILLLPVLLNGLRLLWDGSWENQTSGGGFEWGYLIGLLANWVMFTWMQWHLTLRLYGLIPTIADRVGHWMGFGNNHGYDDGQGTTAAVGAMVAAGTAFGKVPMGSQGKQRRPTPPPSGDKPEPEITGGKK